MTLFEKKDRLILNSEQQKDDYIEKLDQAHVEYNLRIKNDVTASNRTIYEIRLRHSDLKKVI